VELDAPHPRIRLPVGAFAVDAFPKVAKALSVSVASGAVAVEYRAKVSAKAGIEESPSTLFTD
jgi:hypothetical protein